MNGHLVAALKAAPRCPKCGHLHYSPGSIAQLIEASSLGTPAAKAIRARTPPHVAAEILRRVTGD